MVLRKFGLCITRHSSWNHLRARSAEAMERCVARQELDRQLRPYRGKMTAEQLAMSERQYLERNLLEKAGLPRLSLFCPVGPTSVGGGLQPAFLAHASPRRAG